MKCTPVRSMMPGSFHVDVVASVDHHFGHRRIFEELLERSETHHVTGDVPHEQLAFLRRERRLVRVHQRRDLVDDERLHLLFARRFEQSHAEPFEERIVHSRLELGEAVGSER